MAMGLSQKLSPFCLLTYPTVLPALLLQYFLEILQNRKSDSLECEWQAAL